MPDTVLLFARDPGGFNAIAPLIEPLNAKGYRVLLFAKDIALQKFQQAGTLVQDLAAQVNPITAETLEAFLKTQRPDFLITGTSAEDMSEKFLWKAANNLGIPSFAILDQWVNYGIRFSSYGVSQSAQYQQDQQHPYLPTKILVMDNFAKTEMMADLGEQETNRILVSGQPYFDQIFHYAKNRSQEATQSCRQSCYNATSQDIVIGFASEPISIAYPNNYWGYDEQSILKNLVQSLEALLPQWEAQAPNRKLILALRPHPKEDLKTYNALSKQLNQGALKVIVESDNKPWDFILAADMMCGMSSLMLIESAMLNKPILSIQIGLQQEDPFMLSRRGIVPSIQDQGILQETLTDILFNPSKSPTKIRSRFEVIPNATDNVIRFMEQALKCPRSLPAS